MTFRSFEKTAVPSSCQHSSSLPQPGSIAAWMMAARPRTLTAAIAPVWVGTACAHALGGARWQPALAALLGAMWLQIAANFANDAFDFDKGADTSERLGPPRAAQLGLLTSTQLKRGVAVALGAAFLCGVYLTWLAGPIVVFIGLASMLGAVMYTAGPFPLAYHGLGDVFVFVFFGLVAVMGTVFVQCGALAVSPLAVWASVPLGALATAVLVVNHVRDRENDTLANKRTLVVRFGRRFGEIEYGVLVLCAQAVPVVLWLRGDAKWPVLLSLLTLPWALLLWRAVVRERGFALNLVLSNTAKMLAVFGVLFGAGLWWN